MEPSHQSTQLDLFPQTCTPKPQALLANASCIKTEEVRELFAKFLPFVNAIHRQGIRSNCPHYWRSRFSDFIAHSHADSRQVWEEKTRNEALWKPLYTAYCSLLHSGKILEKKGDK